MWYYTQCGIIHNGNIQTINQIVGHKCLPYHMTKLYGYDRMTMV